MKMHSRVGLMTNSSSETFSFSGRSMSSSQVDMIVDSLWSEFVWDPANESDLREWWECNYNRPAGWSSTYSEETLIKAGPPISFSINDDGSFSYFASMNNNEAPELFAAFVEKRMNLWPSEGQCGRCDWCMKMGRNTCPPCRF